MTADDDTPGIFWLLFSPSGRIGRQPYLMSILLWIVLQGIVVAQLVGHHRHGAMIILWVFVLVILCILSLASLIMLTIKRLHDMGFPAIMVLLLFVPVASFFALVAFLFWPSAPPNDYGEFTNRPY